MILIAIALAALAVIILGRRPADSSGTPNTVTIIWSDFWAAIFPARQHAVGDFVTMSVTEFTKAVAASNVPAATIAMQLIADGEALAKLPAYGDEGEAPDGPGGETANEREARDRQREARVAAMIALLEGGMRGQLTVLRVSALARAQPRRSGLFSDCPSVAMQIVLKARVVFRDISVGKKRGNLNFGRPRANPFATRTMTPIGEFTVGEVFLGLLAYLGVPVMLVADGFSGQPTNFRYARSYGGEDCDKPWVSTPQLANTRVGDGAALLQLAQWLVVLYLNPHLADGVRAAAVLPALFGPDFRDSIQRVGVGDSLSSPLPQDSALLPAVSRAYSAAARLLLEGNFAAARNYIWSQLTSPALYVGARAPGEPVLTGDGHTATCEAFVTALTQA